MAPGRLCLLLVLLGALAAAAFELESGLNSNVVETSAQEYLESSPGAAPGLIGCERIRVPGISRWSNAHKFGHGSRVTIAPRVAQVYSRKIHVCVHENTTLGSCQCSKDNWQSLEKGNLTFLKSPFETKLVDVRTLGSIANVPTVSVTVNEEFSLPRVLFLAVGLLLLILAPIVSSWVPFYYSSAMTMGILLIVIILLFQIMRFLPTGRKGSFYVLVYGSMVGAGTLLVRYTTNVLAPLFSQLGMGDDMQKPAVILGAIGVALSGAFLGQWGVRKFVLTSDGSVESGTAKFVKWALRIFGAALMLLSSLDPVFSFLALVLGVLISSMRVRGIFESFRSLEFRFPWSSSGSEYEGWRYRNHIKLWRRKQLGASSSTYHSPVSISGKRVFVSPPSRYKMSPEQDFYSTFHRTPERRRMTKAEYEAVTRECTLSSMESLVSSPKFGEWVVNNADRISVVPQVGRQERPEDEIELTATMD